MSVRRRLPRAGPDLRRDGLAVHRPALHAARRASGRRRRGGGPAARLAGRRRRTARRAGAAAGRGAARAGARGPRPGPRWRSIRRTRPTTRRSGPRSPRRSRRTRATSFARLDGPPQTNEPQRSAALCPGFLTVADRTGLPLVTSELGASAGPEPVLGPLRLPLRHRRLGRPGLAGADRARLAGPAAAACRRRGWSSAPAATALRSTRRTPRADGGCSPSSGPTRRSAWRASTAAIAHRADRRRAGRAGRRHRLARGAPRGQAPRPRPRGLSLDHLAVSAAGGAARVPGPTSRRRAPPPAPRRRSPGSGWKATAPSRAPR